MVTAPRLGLASPADHPRRQDGKGTKQPGTPNNSEGLRAVVEQIVSDHDNDAPLAMLKPRERDTFTILSRRWTGAGRAGRDQGQERRDQGHDGAVE
jgi:hypothetical protein